MTKLGELHVLFTQSLADQVLKLETLFTCSEDVVNDANSEFLQATIRRGNVFAELETQMEHYTAKCRCCCESGLPELIDQRLREQSLQKEAKVGVKPAFHMEGDMEDRLKYAGDYSISIPS